MSNAKPSQASYRDLKDELDSVVLSLQREDIDIDEAVVLFKRGQELIKELEAYLKTSEITINEIKAKFDTQS